MRVNRYDLAALSMRARDALNRATEFLEGRSLVEGQVVTIEVRALVAKAPAGNLIFGSVDAGVVDG